MDKVAVVGTGRVAKALIDALYTKGVLDLVIGRSEDALLEINKSYPSINTSSLFDQSASNITIFILCVSDDSIGDVAQSLRLPESTLLLHTSGTYSLDLIIKQHAFSGILYPVQTFDGGPLEFSQIPICIEGVNEEAEKELRSLAELLSERVHVLDSEQRKVLHVSAVFASNFTNRMIKASDELLEEIDLDSSILKPLVEKTIQNVFTKGADQSLTGPAKRKDQETIDKHQILLEDKPILRSIYVQVTRYIIEQ